MSWETVFESWAEGPGKTEQTKCENAEKAIKAALNDDPVLKSMDTLVFTQGSYRARTNVRQNSDVDICILLRDQYFNDYQDDISKDSLGFVSSDFTFQKFKELVGKALINKFGKDQVTRGNKAFDVHENSYRIDADVVPAFRHRRYSKYSSGGTYYHDGIAFKTDNGNKLIINWPEQTYNNGVEKNDNTNRRYKRVIRILKRLRDHMQEKGIVAAKDIASFLIESLVWNAPNSAFTSSAYSSNVREVLAYTFNKTLTDEECKEWGEVNELKYLFRSAQPWNRIQAHNFLSACWDYLGLE